MDFSDKTQPMGMSELDLFAYLDEVLQEEAAEAAEELGTTVEQELASQKFKAVAAAATYAIKLIDANNLFITRQLIDRGILLPAPEDGAEG